MEHVLLAGTAGYRCAGRKRILTMDLPTCATHIPLAQEIEGLPEASATDMAFLRILINLLV